MTRTFTVRGTRNGSLVHVTWTDGTLTGDPPTVDLLEVQAEIADTVHDDAHGEDGVLRGAAAIALDHAVSAPGLAARAG